MARTPSHAVTVDADTTGPAGAQAFVGGALILVAGSLLSRLLGATYRLVVPILMGGGMRAAVGMGLYQLAYPMFTVLITLITTGFPLAISKLVAERLARGDRAGASQIFRAARAGLPVLGAVFAVALWMGAPWFARHVADDMQAVLPIRAIAPAILTVSFASAYRGMFQGMGDMVPYAISQVVEQIGRVAAMFVLVVLLLPLGIQWAAAGAAFGAVVGGVCASAALVVQWRRRAVQRLQAAAGVGRQRLGAAFASVLRIAAPIAAGATLLPLLNVADAAIVPLRLRAAGMGPESIALYGVLTGYAAPLVLAPTVFTAGLAMSLLPAVAAAQAAGQTAAARRAVESGLRLAALVALPSAAGLAVLAGPLPRLLFHTTLATRPLLAMAPALVFLSLQQTSSGILQALGRPDVPVRNLAVGGAVKVILEWILVASPAWNVTGAALATSVAFAIACSLNLWAVQRRMPRAVDWGGTVLRPALACVIMVAAVLGVVHGLRGHVFLQVTGGVGCGVGVYGAALLAVGGVRREDLERVPRLGPRIAARLVGAGLLRT